MDFRACTWPQQAAHWRQWRRRNRTNTGALNCALHWHCVHPLASAHDTMLLTRTCSSMRQWRQVAARAYSSQAPAERVALVQGASRGLGLEFVRQLLERPGQTVVAACRRPAEAAALQELQRSAPGRLILQQLDCTSEESIEVRCCVGAVW